MTLLAPLLTKLHLSHSSLMACFTSTDSTGPQTVSNSMLTEQIPTEGGGLFFNHWSNGDPKWSAGPPDADTVMTLSYVKGYFNSTDTDRSQNAYKKRCPKFDPAKVCPIPAQTSPPDASQGKDAAKTYFFSQQDNMTPGQILFSNGATIFGAPAISILAPLLVTFISWSLA